MKYCNFDQGWLQIRFFKYKYKYKYACSEFFKYKYKYGLLKFFKYKYSNQIFFKYKYAIFVFANTNTYLDPTLVTNPPNIKIAPWKYPAEFDNISI